MSMSDDRRRIERKAPAPDVVKHRKSKRRVNWEARAEAELERSRKHGRMWGLYEERRRNQKKLRKVKCACGHRGDKHQPSLKHIDGVDVIVARPCFACGYREPNRCMDLTPVDAEL